MYFLYSIGGVTFNKCWITLSILNCYSPNFQGFILMKNAWNNQVGMLGNMFLWLVANLKQGVIYFLKQACGNDVLASVYLIEICLLPFSCSIGWKTPIEDTFCLTIVQLHDRTKSKCFLWRGQNPFVRLISIQNPMTEM